MLRTRWVRWRSLVFVPFRVLRRVASNGYVSVDNRAFSVGNAFKTELVDVFVDQTTIQVWSKNHLINTVARERSGPVRKVRADGLHVKHQPDTERQASARIMPGPPTIPQVGGLVNLCSGHPQQARADLGLSPESSWSLEVGGLARWRRSDPFSRR
jgi:hypothetical protein